MNAVSKELVEVLNGLPEEKAREVVDFVRFLQQQACDREWERIVNDASPRPKLDAFVAEALREEPSKPLDSDKL